MHAVAAACCLLLLLLAGCCWLLLLAAAGCCWLLLAGCCCWLLMAAAGCLLGADAEGFGSRVGGAEGQILYLHGVLTNALTKTVPKSEDAWAKIPKFVGALDKGWMAQWLVKYDSQASTADPITRELLDALESSDPKIIGLLFRMFTMTGEYTEMPEVMQKSRAVSALVFARRAQTVGLFMKDWRKNAVTGTTIDVKKGSAYQLKFNEDGNCTEVLFMNKGSVDIDPDEVRITKKNMMKDPFSIQNCTLVKGWQKYRLLDLFPDDQGPKAHLLPCGKKGGKDKVPNQLIVLANTIARDQDTAKGEVEKGFIPEQADFVGVARKQKMAASLKAASEKAMESQKRRRVVSVA